MSESDVNDRFAAMDDLRNSKFGLINFVAVHLLVLVVFGFWYFTQGGPRVAGLPISVWVIVGAIPIVWVQFGFFIRNSEIRLTESE